MSARRSLKAWSILLAYLAVWAAFLAFEWVLPFESVRGSRSAALLVVFGFLGLSGVAAVFAYLLLMELYPRRAVGTGVGIDVRHISGMIRLASGLASVGVLMVMYDKIAIQGLDFSRGPAFARTQWQELAASRSGVSSPFSAIGNVLSVLFYPSLVLLLLHWERLDTRIKRPYALLGLLLLFSSSYLSGGRSILLLGLSFGASAGLMRKAAGLKVLPAGGLKALSITVLATSAAVAFAMYVFARRAGMNSIPLDDYAMSWITQMGGRPSAGFALLESTSGALSDFLFLGATTGVYLVHSLWILEAVLQLSTHPGSSLFALWITHVNKIPSVSIEHDPYLFHGYFATLPGALLYDFGAIGVLVGGLLLGASLGVVMWTCRTCRGGLLAVGLSTGLLSTLMLSPIGAAFDFMAAPFLALGYLLLASIAILRWPGRTWFPEPEAFA